MKGEFFFQIPRQPTRRQGGRFVDISIKYKYKSSIVSRFLRRESIKKEDEAPDYMEIRKFVLSELNDFWKYTVDAYWEQIAAGILKDLKKMYSFEGISIMLLVNCGRNDDPIEVGNHGAVFTSGKIDPITVINYGMSSE
jgi:hypothetical protein